MGEQESASKTNTIIYAVEALRDSSQSSVFNIQLSVVRFRLSVVRNGEKVGNTKVEFFTVEKLNSKSKIKYKIKSQIQIQKRIAGD